MGAYENPRLINAPNYLAGFQAFEQKFQKGFEEGIEMGKKKIEADKLYVEGVEEAGEKMRLEGEAAIANSTKTRGEVESALKNFYDDALAVEPGGKGLAGLFSGGRQMLGDMDLRKLQNNFTDKVTPLNEMYNRIYDPEFNLTKDSDMSDAQYSKLEEIHNAVKSGRIRTNFSYYSQGDKEQGIDRGFNSKLEILDASGKIINTYSSSELSQIMNNNTQQVRAGIDERHSLVGSNAETYMNRSTSNVKTKATVDADPNARVLSPEDHLDAGISQQIGTANFYNENSLSIQPNANGEYTSVPDITGELNGLYANHGKGKLTSQEEIAILKRTVPTLQNVDDSKLKLILNSNMNMGTEKIKAILGDDFKLLQTAGAARPIVGMEKMTPEQVLKSIHDGQAITKAVIYHESVKKSIVDKGLLNQSYVPPTGDTGGTGGQFDKDLFKVNTANRFAQQQLNKTLKLPSLVLPASTSGLGAGGGSRQLDVNKLGFDEIKVFDGDGNAVNKTITGSRLSSNGLLKIEYEQEAKTIDQPTGEVDENGNPITERVVAAPKVNTNNYNVFTLNGLENLFKDIGGTTATQNVDVEAVYPSYFRDQVYRSIQQNFEANPNYLKNPQTSELRAALIQQYGGMQNIMQGGATSYPKLYRQDWFKAMLELEERRNNRKES
jgi:hypothetical protein|tara:strand:+ start:14050 stop:16044 length:1995 start_codon:yes stop_codon:yes gene_type:complete